MKDKKLKLQHFPAGPNGFFRAPVLVSNEQNAVLIDGGFTFSDGKAIAQAISESGRRLIAIYVSQSDPDYYFSLGKIKDAFPHAPVLGAPAALDAIKGNVQKKLAVWGPKLQANGPQSMAEIILPEASSKNLVLDGEMIEIVETRLNNRRYLWSESLKAIFGGVLVFSDVHVWVADLPSVDQRVQWLEILDQMAAREPEIVVAGHMQVNSAINASALKYTRDYLIAFEEERSKSSNSKELIQAMKCRYPAAGMEVALEIGAQVIMGEMKWG